MAKKVFKANLSSDGIDNLINELNLWKTNTLQYKIDKLCKSLADEGVDVARANVASYDAIFTGELIDSIHTVFGESQNSTCVFYVRADSEHAAFVEFGTGILGNEGSYPYPFPDGVSWKYITGKQLVANIKKGLYGWFYKDDNGQIMFTEGMPSRPFMYETELELSRIVEKLAKEIFKND